MRFLVFLASAALCLAWVILLDRPLGPLPAMGKLLDPVNGMWANAEPSKPMPVPKALPSNPYDDPVTLDMDPRLVPHLRAQSDQGLYFAQGYLHAYYRLWQMDMQSRAAAGRLSEVVGESALPFDREQRRKGMLWAALNSLHAMEADPLTRSTLEAYTAGVNAFIESLSYKDYPLEYKLMGFSPEPWTHLKCALLLKLMADDLTGQTDDIAMSYLRTALGQQEVDNLYPDIQAGSMPVIPPGTSFRASQSNRPVPAEKVFPAFEVPKGKAQVSAASMPSPADQGIGSNNWALSGTLTASKAAILCNDPHLGLNLPAIWYEMQLTAPGINCYGASIPGAPGIIIGFNDSIAWGVTNNYRDVKDYYEIVSEDPRLYVFDKKEVPFNHRYETIAIKGRSLPFVDTVRYTLHGPVIYDENYPEPSGSGKMLAVTWAGHKGSNELLSVYRLNRARDYRAFVEAIRYFECPAQNFAYADRQGHIAIWGQGTFINKWKDQGKYVMRGDISATLWGERIPFEENPHIADPITQYVSSANQAVTDPTYPYWYNGGFSEFRSWSIHQRLDSMVSQAQAADLDLMGKLQNNTKSIAFEKLDARLRTFLEPEQLSFRDGLDNGSGKPYEMDGQSERATFDYLFQNQVYLAIWKKKFEALPLKRYPSMERTIRLMLEDSASRYYDDPSTPEREGLRAKVQQGFVAAKDSLLALRGLGLQKWYKFKNTTVSHMAKIAAFSYRDLPTGGWGNTINAMKHDHGPSLRIMVEMRPEAIVAMSIYPGGQSGNPGSRFYASFLDKWAQGRYDTVRFHAAHGQ